jgi:hypothetical protein
MQGKRFKFFLAGIIVPLTLNFSKINRLNFAAETLRGAAKIKFELRAANKPLA